MNKKIAIVGGDLRIIELVKMYSSQLEVITYGLEKAEELVKDYNVKCCNELKNAVKETDFVISSLPFSRDGETVFAPFSNNKISIKELFECVEGKMLFAGSITEEILKLAKENNVKIVDLMKQEELVILNTIATAEGAIEVALRETNINIHGSNVLILGFGRVGKTTAMKFSALSANVTCSARKEKDFAWIETLGFKSVNTNNLKENLNKYEIIINTIPTMILSKEELKYVNKDCLIIDLASKPGGVDFDEAKRLGINARLELALPGKVAPKTSAKYIKTAIENIRKNKEE